MIDIHNKRVDVICDRCKTRLFEFLNKTEDFPETIKQAEELALDHDWRRADGKDLCNKCK